MGYYTRYTLDISLDNSNVTQEEIEEEMKAMDLAVDSIKTQSDDMKWYDHEEDMRDFSKKFPDVLFILDGAGEESGDIWKKYFKNGLMQSLKPKLKFPPYNPARLK